MADLVDWADIAAVGVMMSPLLETVPDVLEQIDRLDIWREYHATLASALRQAYEAGERAGHDYGYYAGYEAGREDVRNGY